MPERGVSGFHHQKLTLEQLELPVVEQGLGVEA